MKRILILFLLMSLLLNQYIFTSLGEEQDQTLYESHYILDTGNVHLWANSSGAWIKDNNGLYPAPDTNYDNPNSIRIELPDNAILKSVMPYNGKNFLFEEDENKYHWNKGKIAFNKTEYDRWYFRRSSKEITINDYNQVNDEAYYNWSVKLTPWIEFYDVKNSIIRDDRAEYFNFFGGEDYCKENLPYLVDQYDDMVDQVFSPKVQGLLIFIPIVIEYQLPVNTPVVHVSHFEEDGTPLDEYDYTDYIGVGETKTYDATDLYGLTQVGSKVSYNMVPSGSIDTDIVSVVVTANETVKDIYIEFYYKETVIPPPPDDSISKNEMDTEAQGFIKADDRGVDEVLDSEEFDDHAGIPC